MSKKQKLLDRHAAILKIAQDSGHEQLLEEANGLYDVIATLAGDGEGDDDTGGQGGNNPIPPPKNP